MIPSLLSWSILIQMIAFIVLLGLSLFYYDRRYKKRKESAASHKPNPGFERTAEVFFDPKDGVRYRVYYHFQTGERDYIRED